MATTKQFLDYLYDQLAALPEVTHRAMMGEYVLYYRGKVIGVVCDNCLYIKPVPSACAMAPDTPLAPPYPGARPMLPVARIDDAGYLCALFAAAFPELPTPKPKRRRRREI